jgi:hypothetical protein
VLEQVDVVGHARRSYLPRYDAESQGDSRVTKSAEEIPAPAAGADAKEKSGGIVRDWIVPIVLGFAIGGGLVGAWRAGRGMLRSKAAVLVEKSQSEEGEDLEAVIKELHGLGPSARADLVAVLRDLPADRMDTKIFVARQLAGDPWFDTTSLKEIVRDEKAPKEDRRAAACALVDTQLKEVDAELVLPVFEAWLLDATSQDRESAVPRVEQMWRAGMLNSAWEARVKTALLGLAKRVAVQNPDDEDRVAGERGAALLALEVGMPDDEIKKTLWAVAKDDADKGLPRIDALRALSESGVVEEADLADWAVVAKSKNEDVRQTVADNLFRAKLPEYDKVIGPLQFDEKPETRLGALDTQTKRRRPTMLARFDEFLEDHEKWVRFNAMFAAGVFKNETEGLPQRAAIMLRLLETSDEPVDVKGAMLAMKMITDQVFGVKAEEVHLHEQTVEEAPLAAFMKDKELRTRAAESWRKCVGAAAVWTDGDRRKTLEKLLQHADPLNVERAKVELAALGGK